MSNRGVGNVGVVAMIVAVKLAACGGNPVAPTPGPSISCPAPVTVTSTNGGSAQVTYAAPIVTGGAAPVATACTPASGSSFPIGSTTVTCSARDAQQRTASCTFQVAVTSPPRLAFTNFLAFGDSITAGEINNGCPTTRTTRTPTFLIEDLRVLPRDVDLIRAYPNQLELLLRSRYSAQTPTVANGGSGGECAGACPSPNPGNGPDRLPSALTGLGPQVLLLQEGINNINSNDPASIPVVVNGLRTMIRDARARGVIVFLGTLLPERPGACRAFAPNLIPSANDQIRALASAESAFLVDLYAAFGGVAGDLIGNDGLHPNEAGYRKIAETFFDAIRSRLETQ